MTLVEEFEEAFLSCLDSLVIEATDSTSGDDNGMELEIRIERFLGLARRMNVLFTQNKIILSSLSREETFNENVNKLREELESKEELLQLQHEKITNWQMVLDCLLEEATKGDLGADTSCTYDGDLNQASSNQPATRKNDNSKAIREKDPSDGSEYSQSPITVQLHSNPKFVLVEQEQENSKPMQGNLQLQRPESIRIKLMQGLQKQLLRLQDVKLEEYRAVHKLQRQELEQDIDASANHSREIVSNEQFNDDE